jgi:hypothetical protein
MDIEKYKEYRDYNCLTGAVKVMLQCKRYSDLSMLDRLET